MYNNSLDGGHCVSVAIIGNLIMGSCQYACTVMIPNLLKCFIYMFVLTNKCSLNALNHWMNIIHNSDYLKILMI